MFKELKQKRFSIDIINIAWREINKENRKGVEDVIT